MRLKKLNTALFPVRYNDKYYATALASGEFTKLGLLRLLRTLKVVSALPPPTRDPIPLSLLPFGRLKVLELRSCDLSTSAAKGLLELRHTLEKIICHNSTVSTRLLNHVLDLCSKKNIPEIYLHVQTNNEDAINFYKKFGFEITETIKNYYTNIDPIDCFVLTKFTAPSQAKK
ncbi:hypothetical protein J1N35_026638 [Gossypium stocksii]|uniref:N-acetyltransferase domain-containing protein n=1 Tax=Gossypium stocksii TaxID=47602 RepID=A0A9D3ZXA4_9ROSI|nr:hypothetical protein J1N35_026638 [Gossypium stocksii]